MCQAWAKPAAAATPSSARGVSVRRAFELANIAIEGNEIVGQEGFEAANADFNAPDPGFDLAVEPPPHGDQDAQDGNEEYNFCPVHGDPSRF